jgi:hypothetical protein
VSGNSRVASPAPKTRPQFSQPFRQIVLMLTVLGLSGAGAFLALPRVMPVFQANPYLNGFILGVFFIGVLACFWQVLQLIGSVRWIEAFASGNHDPNRRAPRTLAPVASLLSQRGARMQLSSTSTRSILDSVATRIDEQREITRYIVNLLIFLGLLGTFYGLATTVPALVETIRGLAPREGEEGVDVFNRLMTGLEAQLGGMGVAFASSLIGLAGSLIVGLLELFAGHGQNRFYRELEEWLSSMTRVGLTGDGEASEASVVGAVLDQLGAQLEAMQMLAERSEENRAALDDRMGTLAQAVTGLAERMDRTGGRDGPDVTLDRIAAQGERTTEALSQLAEHGAGTQDALAQLSQHGAGTKEAFARLVAHSEVTSDALAQLAAREDGSAEALARLTALGDGTGAALARLADGQQELIDLVRANGGGDGIDAESRMRLRSIDVQMLRILEEISAGRQENLAALRHDFETLVAAVARPGAAKPRQTSPGKTDLGDG